MSPDIRQGARVSPEKTDRRPSPETEIKVIPHSVVWRIGPKATIDSSRIEKPQKSVTEASNGPSVIRDYEHNLVIVHPGVTDTMTVNRRQVVKIKNFFREDMSIHPHAEVKFVDRHHPHKEWHTLTPNKPDIELPSGFGSVHYVEGDIFTIPTQI